MAHVMFSSVLMIRSQSIVNTDCNINCNFGKLAIFEDSSP